MWRVTHILRFNPFHWYAKKSNDWIRVSKLFSCSSSSVNISWLSGQCSFSSFRWKPGVHSSSGAPRARLSAGCCAWGYKWEAVNRTRRSHHILNKVKTLCQVDSWHIKVSAWAEMSNAHFCLGQRGAKAFGKMLWWHGAAWSNCVSLFLHSSKCQNFDWSK